MAADDADFTKLPLEEKVAHKVCMWISILHRFFPIFVFNSQNWKARVAGYEEAKKLFDTADENSPVFSRHQSLLKGMLGDANVVALEKGLDAVISFISNAPPKLGANPGIAQVHILFYLHCYIYIQL